LRLRQLGDCGFSMLFGEKRGIGGKAPLAALRAATREGKAHRCGRQRGGKRAERRFCGCGSWGGCGFSMLFGEEKGDRGQGPLGGAVRRNQRGKGAPLREAAGKKRVERKFCGGCNIWGGFRVLLI
jgi:hypothetical protein